MGGFGGDLFWVEGGLWVFCGFGWEIGWEEGLWVVCGGFVEEEGLWVFGFGFGWVLLGVLSLFGLEFGN